MNDTRLDAFHKEVQRVLQFLATEYGKLQTGRANPALIEHVSVEAYGQSQPLRNVAGISVPDARTIVVQPWDRTIMQAVEKALQQANLGTSPVNDGTVIRLNLPQMNEERRLQLTKVVHQLAEEARISVRKSRQDIHDSIKAEKDEDVKETLMEALQKAVDDANAKVAEAAKKKEEEVMKV
ncbi:MAG: ribosome recycling factor [Candidatus Peregrinibacteria bacterium]|nr:ribosome recycling factor [Candidatus Peregrinibacteria bacterium]